MKRMLLFGVSWLILVTLLITCFAFPEVLITETSPDSFPTSITELAANDDTIFLLDNHLNTIQAYSYEGENLYTITFSSSGTNYIYVENGLLHRYDARKTTIYEYIDNTFNSEIMTTYDFVPLGHGLNPNEFITSVEVSDTSIRFVDHIIKASTVEIDGAESHKFTVESVTNHIISILLILISICSLLIGLYSLLGLLKSGMNHGFIKWTWEWWGLGKKKR